MNDSVIQQFHLSQKFLVVVTENVQNVKKSLNEMFAVLWRNGLINSHILIQNDELWFIYTFKPYQRDCTSLVHVKIASFTLTNYTEHINFSFEEFYSPKLENFNRCPLYVAATEAAPFTIYNNKSEVLNVSGIEITMVENIAKKLNCTLIYENSPIGRGRIFENGTGTGNLNMVLTGQVNFTIGAYQQTNVRSTYLVESDSVFHPAYGLVFKVETLQNQSVSPISAPFKPNLWLLISTVIFITVLLILWSKKLTQKWRHFYIGGRMNRSPILNMWISVLGKSIANPCIANGRYISNFARTLAILWILLWFIVRSWYEGTFNSDLWFSILIFSIDEIFILSIRYFIYTKKSA